MKRFVLAAAIAALASPPALAQGHSGHDDMASERLQRLDDAAKARGYSITHAKAIEIAKANGVVTVREIDLEENAEWKVEGRTAEGHEIEVELSARDGKVRKVEHD